MIFECPRCKSSQLFEAGVYEINLSDNDLKKLPDSITKWNGQKLCYECRRSIWEYLRGYKDALMEVSDDG